MITSISVRWNDDKDFLCGANYLIGGDEVMADEWRRNPDIHKAANEKGWIQITYAVVMWKCWCSFAITGGIHQLQLFFNNKLSTMLEKSGRKMVRTDHYITRTSVTIPSDRMGWDISRQPTKRNGHTILERSVIQDAFHTILSFWITI